MTWRESLTSLVCASSFPASRWPAMPTPESACLTASAPALKLPQSYSRHSPQYNKPPRLVLNNSKTLFSISVFQSFSHSVFHFITLPLHHWPGENQPDWNTDTLKH